MKVKIVGTGSAVPEKCVTNDDLSQWMDTSDEWIRSRTGIETRHLAVRETTTEMAVEAAKRALASAHMDAEELDLIIAATITPDRLLPNPAWCRAHSGHAGRSPLTSVPPARVFYTRWILHATIWKPAEAGGRW